MEGPGGRHGKNKPLGRLRGDTRNSGEAEYIEPSRERQTDKYTLQKESSSEGRREVKCLEDMAKRKKMGLQRRK